MDKNEWIYYHIYSDVKGQKDEEKMSSNWMVDVAQSIVIHVQWKCGKYI